MKTGKRNSTGANGGNGEENLCSLRSLLFKSGSGGVVELDFDKSISDGVNIYANPEGFRGDFVFLARDTCLRRERKRYGRQAASRYIDNPDASGLVATKPELRK